jgi:hypothetical protein
MKIILCISKPNYESAFDWYFKCYDTSGGFKVSNELKQRPVLAELWFLDNWKRYINNEIHNWLVFYKIKYSLFMIVKDEHTDFEEKQWGIDISDVEKAMLFKLTWCGQ